MASRSSRRLQSDFQSGAWQLQPIRAQDKVKVVKALAVVIFLHSCNKALCGCLRCSLDSLYSVTTEVTLGLWTRSWQITTTFMEWKMLTASLGSMTGICKHRKCTCPWRSNRFQGGLWYPILQAEGGRDPPEVSFHSGEFIAWHKEERGGDKELNKSSGETVIQSALLLLLLSKQPQIAPTTSSQHEVGEITCISISTAQNSAFLQEQNKPNWIDIRRPGVGAFSKSSRALLSFC